MTNALFKKKKGNKLLMWTYMLTVFKRTVFDLEASIWVYALTPLYHMSMTQGKKYQPP
jgi:hypothetical protein